jgi:hypothetical protein
MWLLVVYILNVLVGDSIVIAIGLGLDRTFPYVSLPVSLSLFFFVFWLSWVLAVRWTEPKHARSAKLAS